MSGGSQHVTALREVRAVLVQRRRAAAARFVKEVPGMPALAAAPLIAIQADIAALDAAIADEEHLARHAGHPDEDIPTPHV